MSIDDPVAGVFTYDLSATDTYPEEGVGRYFYYAPPNGIHLTISGLTFRTDPDDVEVHVGTHDDPASSEAGWDQFALIGHKCLLPYSPEQNENNTIGIGLTDNTATALSSEHLPTSLDIDDWDEASVLVLGYEMLRHTFSRSKSRQSTHVSTTRQVSARTVSMMIATGQSMAQTLTVLRLALGPQAPRLWGQARYMAPLSSAST